MKTKEISRRDLLRLIWRGLLYLCAALGLAALARFLGYQPPAPPPVEIPLGNARDYPAGSRTYIPPAQAVLVHAAQGFLAYDLICTHLGCVVKMEGDEFHCPCHGSRFAADGSVLRGPALKALRVLPVNQKPDGSLVLLRGG